MFLEQNVETLHPWGGVRGSVGCPGGAQQALGGSLSLPARTRGGCRSLYKRPGKLLEAAGCGEKSSGSSTERDLRTAEQGRGRGLGGSVTSPHLCRACHGRIEEGQGPGGCLLGVIVRKSKEGGRRACLLSDMEGNCSRSAAGRFL